MPTELTSRDPAIRRVEVGSYPDTGKPFTVELEPFAPLTVRSLASTFGAYRQSRTDRGMAREIIFPAIGTGTWQIVIIAQLPPGSSPIADESASIITLRRDPR